MIFVLFHVKGRRFVLPVKHIMEITPRVKLSLLPHTPDYVKGLLDFRGKPIPVVDFCHLIEERPSANCMHTRILVIKYVNTEGKKEYLGLIAEKITETIALDENKFTHSGVNVENTPYLDGILSDEKGMIRFVLIDKLFEFLHDLLYQ